MLVLLTGGTGFVGSHTVAALARRGHRVRLLARRPARVTTALAPHHIAPEAIESIVVGDATDAERVRHAVSGCDAVVHAAAVYSLDVAAAAKIHRVNARAAETVLGAARDAAIDPIVYVSSYVTYLGAGRSVIAPDDPVGTPKGAYAQSKAAAEARARSLQQDGVPITSIYPGTVWGPHDPRGRSSDSQRTALLLLRGRSPFALAGGFPIVDVRTIAAAVAASIERGRGPRRYLLGGHYVTWRELTAMMRDLTGRRLVQVPTPLALAKATGRVADTARRVLPVRPPFGYEAPWYLEVSPRTDDRRALDELALVHPPARETIADQLDWMATSGLLSPRQAGIRAAASVAIAN
jgi:nucleoside-diphosphate-sugar epimerase